MRSFFRFIMLIILLISTYAGGWLSSSLFSQDPFLSNIFPSVSNQYDRFVRDLTAIIQDMKTSDQSQLVEQLFNSSWITDQLQHQLQTPPNAIEVNGTIPSNDFGDIETPELDTNYEVYDAPSIVSIDPNTMIGGIVKQMSAKEKLTFLVWARSRFTNTQLQEIERILQDGITPESFLTLYQFTRKSLKGEDIEYLLSFVDRYLNTLQPAPDDAIPVFQNKESSMNRPN